MMRTTVTATISLAICLAYNLIAQSPQPHPEIETISGRNFVVIQSAAAEAARRGLDVSTYKITILDRGSSCTVMFQDPERPATQMGSTERMLGFDVEVSRKDLRIVRSHFVR
jgi:hypothetical protein